MIRRFIRLGMAFAIIALCSSCDILRDSPFEVSAWSPGGGYHANPEAIRISLSFSHDPDRSSVEKNFSISGNGEQMRGIFHWNGRKMDFLLYVPLEENREYFVRLSSGAHDTTGLSMDRDFEGRFNTRLDSARVRVESFMPEMGGTMEGRRGTCVIRFSSPVSLNSLRSNASFSPSISGTWTLDEGGLLAVFTPSEPWPHGRRLEMRLSAFLEGENRIGMGKDFFSIFTIGTNLELPKLTGAWRVTENGTREELVEETLSQGTTDEYKENTGWEKGDRLLLVFSAPVDLLSVSTALAVEGGSSLVLEMPGGIPPEPLEAGYSEEAVFRFERPPVFESRFFLRLRSGIKDRYGNDSEDEHSFRVFANGENSRPPSLIGIRIPMSPGGIPDTLIDYNLRSFGYDQLFADFPIESGNYPFNTKTATWIECYFDSAPGAVIDTFSLMETFRVETSNNVLQFSPLAVRTASFTVADPHAAWEQYQRLEIMGTLTNTVNSGLVHFLVNQGLRDSADNSSEKQFRISLLK